MQPLSGQTFLAYHKFIGFDPVSAENYTLSSKRAFASLLCGIVESRKVNDDDFTRRCVVGM